MKINFGKLAKVLGQVIVAAPAVAAAIKPVLDAARRPGIAQVPKN